MLHGSTLKSRLSYGNQPRLDIFMRTINVLLFESDPVRAAHKLEPREDFCDTYLNIRLPKLILECPDAIPKNSSCAFVALGTGIELVDIFLVSGNQIIESPPADSSGSPPLLVDSFGIRWYVCAVGIHWNLPRDRSDAAVIPPFDVEWVLAMYHPVSFAVDFAC